MTKNERCIAEFAARGMAMRFTRCTRKAVQGGYCKQHHPDTVASKRAERNEKWDAERRREREIARRRVAEHCFCEGMSTDDLEALAENGETALKWMREVRK